MKARRSDFITRKACCLPAALLLLAASASAEVIIVTSNADVGPGTLRDSVNKANLNPGPDEINFADDLGTITLASQIEISETLTIVGPSAGQVISGGGLTRIFAVTTQETALTLENLVLTDARTTVNSGAPSCSETDGQGGALCSRSIVHLRGVTVQDSKTEGNGAAGGGMMLRAGATILNSSIRRNETVGPNADGGGLRSLGPLTIHNSLFEANRAVASSGGGLSTPSGRDFIMTNSAVVNNSAGGGSGGLRVSRALMENSVVSGNSAQFGGGMTIDLTVGLGGDPGTPVIRNSTISDNLSLNKEFPTVAGLRAIYYQTDYTLRLESVIVSGNEGPAGDFGVVGATTDPNQDTAQVTVDAVHSLFGDDASEINGQNLNNLFSADPRLKPLADLGCAVPAGAPGTEQCVPVHAFRAASPAVNAGSNPAGLEFDQRGAGFPRVNDGQADIGAYESNDALFTDRFEMQP